MAATMAGKFLNSPLPPLPPAKAAGPAPISIPRRPVGGNNAFKPAPGEVSPVESLSSLYSAYSRGTDESSDNIRSSSGGTSTTYEPSPPPPKVLPKDSLGVGADKLDLISPFALTHFGATNTNHNHNNHQLRNKSSQSQLGRSAPQNNEGPPPPPPVKDSHSHLPATPKSAKQLPARPTRTDSLNQSINNSPSSLTNQSPSQPQIWRRRSIKTDKNLALPGLQLTSSNGSTAASSSSSTQQLDDLLREEELPAPPKPFAAGTSAASASLPITNSFPGRNIRSNTQKRLPDQPSQIVNELTRPEIRTSKSTEDFRTQSPYAAPQKSPHNRRPPTPEYANHETETSIVETVMSPASPAASPKSPSPVRQAVSPASPAPPPAMTAENRPLSSIHEDLAVPPKRVGPGELRSVRSASTLRVRGPPPTGPLPAAPVHHRSPSDFLFPPQNSNGIAHQRGPSDPHLSPGQARRPAPSAPSAPVRPAGPGHSTSPSVSSQLSQRSVVSDTTTIKPQGLTSPSHSNSRSPSPGDAEPAPARPGEPAYFPATTTTTMVPIAPGTVIPAPPLKQSQLDCYADHYRFVASRNEYYPLACQTCAPTQLEGGPRWTCSFCGVRVCGECREGLVVNGRDLKKFLAATRDD